MLGGNLGSLLYGDVSVMFDEIPLGLVSLVEFKVDYSNFSIVQKFRNFTVQNIMSSHQCTLDPLEPHI